MPRLSVVVPVYNVEPYLSECLDSLTDQGIEDFEAILIDDGSTDQSGAIADRYAERDSRFRVVHRSNGGLGSARNAGVALARGQYLAFLDSDDMVAPSAYARMLTSLERTGADFVTGNVHRFDRGGTWPAAFLARTFLVGRRRTHVSRFRWLLSDRMAQNKLWRRDFWEAHRLRFPEGVLHEDIAVVIRAHVVARAVDVLTAPVYLYRQREDGPRSITQHRAELRCLLDRLAAVEQVSAVLGGHSERIKRWYDEGVVEEDLRYHLDVLDEADHEYRTVFLDRANAFLDRAAPGVEDRLPAIQRLKWHLVRRRRLEELIEVVRFERDGGVQRRRRIRGRVYGDYPLLTDGELGVPRGVFRIDTGRRRARHVAAMARPYVTPHRPVWRAPRQLPSTPRVPAAGAPSR